MMRRLLVACAILALALFARAQAATPSSAAATGAPVPWLVIDPNEGYRMARYGFRDRASGEMKIPAIYADARPFQNGFAVVGKLVFAGPLPRGIRYGVIDASGRVVIPLDYHDIELVTKGPLTLAFTQQSYNAWWRFWDWNWHFSLLGTSPPLTRVPRDRWQVLTLPAKHVLLSERMSYLKSVAPGEGMHHRYRNGDSWAEPPSTVVPFALDVTAPSNLVRIGPRLYRLDRSGALTRITGTVIRFSPDGAALVRDGKEDALIGPDGQRLPATFAPTRDFTFHDSRGNTLVPTLYDTMSGATWWREYGDPRANPAGLFRTADFKDRYPFIRQHRFYRDARGRIYVAPEFRVPLPLSIHDYNCPDGHVTAGDIIGHALLIAALPDGKGFLVATHEGNDYGRLGRTFILNLDGSWNLTAPTFLQAPAQFFPDGRVFFVGPHSHGILNADFTFTPLPLASAVPCAGHAHWYLGQNAATRKYGVYDAAHQRWQVPPHYDRLQDELVPGIGVYRTDSTVQRAGGDFPQQRYGLIDIAHNREITPPLYDFVDADGRVGQVRPFVNGYGVKVEPGFAFYLDPHTGAPFLTELALDKTP